MAYAGIAGLPPQAGLYTLVASLLLYALLGTSRHLVVQATSATAALIASSVAAALLFLLPRWNKKIPAGLVVLFGTILLSSALDLHGNFGVEVVGRLPQGLPTLTLPMVPFTSYLAMILPAIGALLVAYSEALGVTRTFAEKHGYEVEPNQELDAHAVATLVSAIFGGMIAAGSVSASAVKEGAGARTQVTNLVTWVVTILTVLFLTPLFATLPEAVLAGMIEQGHRFATVDAAVRSLES